MTILQTKFKKISNTLINVLPSNKSKMAVMTICGLLLVYNWQAINAFCGFYVARADTKLFNKASRVVLVRKDNKTVITMASDYQGSPKDFALVVPVPTFIKRGQINVAEPKLLEHLDAYSAPRLVEYFDNNPCRVDYPMMDSNKMRRNPARSSSQEAKASGMGVKVEARYTVGEYDIVILSASQSNGLVRYLKANKYSIPKGAERVLGGYIKQGMRFFVAKVNLERKAKNGFSYLRPIQIAYESRKFMLPIRLGTVNANGPQELVVFALTEKGRVETTNYRTVKIPSGMEIPAYVKQEFGDFYKSMFADQVRRENMRAVFLEYAWNMAWCDPCAANPLTQTELRKLGVFWLNNNQFQPQPNIRRRMPPNRRMPPVRASNVYITRLHLRYTGETFPEDLMFQETGDRSNFQGRYIIRHPYKGGATCSAADNYYSRLPQRQENRAKTLARLTNWDMEKILKRMNINNGEPKKPATNWWQGLWK